MNRYILYKITVYYLPRRGKKFLEVYYMFCNENLFNSRGKKKFDDKIQCVNSPHISYNIKYIIFSIINNFIENMYLYIRFRIPTTNDKDRSNRNAHQNVKILPSFDIYLTFFFFLLLLCLYIFIIR